MIVEVGQQLRAFHTSVMYLTVFPSQHSKWSPHKYSKPIDKKDNFWKCLVLPPCKNQKSAEINSLFIMTLRFCLFISELFFLILSRYIPSYLNNRSLHNLRTLKTNIQWTTLMFMFCFWCLVLVSFLQRALSCTALCSSTQMLMI